VGHTASHRGGLERWDSMAPVAARAPPKPCADQEVLRFAAAPLTPRLRVAVRARPCGEYAFCLRDSAVVLQRGGNTLLSPMRPVHLLSPRRRGGKAASVKVGPLPPGSSATVRTRWKPTGIGHSQLNSWTIFCRSVMKGGLRRPGSYDPFDIGANAPTKTWSRGGYRSLVRSHVRLSPR
jgi:hypothetical protein